MPSNELITIRMVSRGGWKEKAESTGLEPATSAVTGQRSNQLSYDSNPRNAKLEPIDKAFNLKIFGWGQIHYQETGVRNQELKGKSIPRGSARRYSESVDKENRRAIL